MTDRTGGDTIPAPAGPGLILGASAVALLGLLILGGTFPLPSGETARFFLSWYFFADQDRFLLFLAACILTLSVWLAPRAKFDAAAGLRRATERRWLLPGLIIGAAVFCWVGTYLIFSSTPVSYDEVMAEFDRRIFATGRLAAPLPEHWRPFLPALVRTFWLDIPGHAAWISSYWPGNAALRALAGLTIGASWTGPLLAAITIAATADVARRIFRQDKSLWLVAVALLLLSPQFLLMAMTPYAMSAHLALNMVWLALFLRDRPLAHAGALMVSMLATGLHQLVFHPLFVLPFLGLRLLEGRYRLVSVYVAAFTAILMIWTQYPELVKTLYGIATPNPPDLGVAAVGNFFTRWTSGLSASAGLSGHAVFLPLTVLNTLRFLAWQSPLLMPLFLASVAGLRGEQRIVQAMAAGVALTFLFMVVVLPYQGRGWGYRYMHGELAIMALLAAHGFRRLAGDDASGLWPRAGVIAACLGALLQIPMAAIQAAHFTDPILRGTQLIRAAQADVVVIDENGLPFASDLVRNDPDLSNRPLIMQLAALTPDLITRLCNEQKKVMLFDRKTGVAISFLATAGGEDAPGPAPSENRKLLDAACAPERLLPQQ